MGIHLILKTLRQRVSRRRTKKGYFSGVGQSSWTLSLGRFCSFVPRFLKRQLHLSW
jgi:hypothetical protein